MNFKYNSSYMREQSGRTEAGNDRETGSVSQKCFRGSENPKSLYWINFCLDYYLNGIPFVLLEQFSRIMRKRCSQIVAVVREKRSVLLVWIVWIIFHSKVSSQLKLIDLTLFSSLIKKRAFDKIDILLWYSLEGTIYSMRV